MVSNKEGPDIELVNVQLRMQEESRAAIADNTQTFLGALGEQTREHQKAVQDMMTSMDERDKRHEATMEERDKRHAAATERMLGMILERMIPERTVPAPAAPQPQAAPPAGPSPRPSAAPGPSGAGRCAPARTPMPRRAAAAPSVPAEYRVYTDGKTHAECIVENCEAKVCSFKGAYLDPYRPGRESKQAPFCVEHHNQLVDLKAFGGNNKLSQFPMRVMCPHCLESVTFEEAQTNRHFYLSYRPGTTDQLLLAKPKGNCGGHQDQAPAKRARS